MHSVCTNQQGNADEAENSAQSFRIFFGTVLNLCDYNGQAWFFIALTFARSLGGC